MRDALAEVRAASARADMAAPYRSYQAKGWSAQLARIERVKAGTDAAAAAGLNVSDRTRKAWADGTREPSRANKERIAAAYEALRTRDVQRASAEYDAARARLSERLSEALRNRYGSEIRLRDIRSLDLDP